MPGAVAERPALVLAGGGHAHALVLLQWIRRGGPAADITLVCDTDRAPYSGMLPGEVAGVYAQDQTHIDLPKLCRAAGVRFVQARITGIDRTARQLQLDGQSPLAYDWLSLNLGATPQLQAAGAAQHALPVKPIAGFRQRWQALRLRALAHDGDLRIAVVGAGAAGVELALALQTRLASERAAAGRQGRLELTLLSAGPTVLPGFPAAVQQGMADLLVQRGIRVRCAARVETVQADRLRTVTGEWLPTDAVLWVTQAGAAPWLATTGLALDSGGFVQVQRSLRCVNDARVLAAGDMASVEGLTLAKSGVVAVRQAPVLAANLGHALAGRPLQDWTPQRHWLAILATGDGSAVAVRGRWHVQGRWVWRWKDWIDRRFMQAFEEASR